MILLALLSLVWHIAPQTEITSEPSSIERKKAAAETASAGSESEGPWVATCRFFGGDSRAHEKNGESTFCVPAGAKITFMIATVPDPTRTRLGLFLDRGIESFQKAAQRAGWDFDSQWLPWKFGSDGAGEGKWLPLDKDRSEPGILIFRRDATRAGPNLPPAFPKETLFVFIVGESPTSGIDRFAFSRSFEYRAALGLASVPFDILGPTFSGSLPSLAASLAGHYKDVRRAYSGTVTYKAYADAFHAETGIDFRSATQSSAETTNDLLRVADRLGITRNEVAILSEDETAFGRFFLAGSQVVTIPFPREISSLRNAWQPDQPQQSTKIPGASKVPLSLRDLEGGSGNVPIFGLGQTPLSQYAAVTEIVRRVREHFKLVEIAATNVLDSMFLAEVLHEGAPDTRLIIPTADLLFVRAARDQSLAGVLALTYYPLFITGREWTNDQRSISVFTDGNSEGIYNAAYLLLANDPPPAAGQSAALDYGLPFAPQVRRPVEWLTESTATGFWPITSFEPVSEKAGKAPAMPPAQKNRPELAQMLLPRQWWILNLLMIATTLWFSRHVLMATRVARTSYEIFRTPPDANAPSHAAYTVVAIICALGILTALNAPVASEIVAKPWAFALLSAYLALAVIALFVALIYTCAKGGLRCWILCLLAIATPAAVAWPLISQSRLDNNLLAIRYLHLDNGSSPAVPVILLLFALCGCAVFQMNRFSMAAYRNPGRPFRGLDAGVQKSLNLFASRVEELTEHPAMGFPGWPRVLAILIVAALLLAWTRPWRNLYTIDGRELSLVIFVFSALVLAAVFWTLNAITNVWKSFHNFLAELNRLPLDGAFRRLPHQFSGSAIWSGMPMARTFVTFFGSAECMREFVFEYSALDHPENDFLALARQHLANIESRIEHLREWERTGELTDHDALVCDYRNCADFLVHQYLAPLWRAGKRDPDLGSQDAVREDVNALPRDEKIYRLAAKFVALRYAAWLRYVLRHVRNLLFFISAGFALLSIALLSVNFQAPQTIRWFLTAVFILIGIPLLRFMMQMDRDAVLSRMADDKPGELNKNFYIRAGAYVALPLLGVLSNTFPGFSRLLFSWLQPALDVLK